MIFKVIKNNDGEFYNPTKDSFQLELTKACLLDNDFADLTFKYMDDCELVTFELVEIKG